MASQSPPQKGVAYTFYVGLHDQTNTKLLKANPTLASGDAKVSIDGGAFANLATLPDANPASGRAVRIQLSAAEMGGDNIVVQMVDASGAEWCDLLVSIQTSARSFDQLGSQLKKNTALSNFEFVMRDSTTHLPVAGKTVTGTVSLDGAAFAALTNSASSLASGVYKINLAAADLNCNTGTLKFSATGCDDTLIPFVTEV